MENVRLSQQRKLIQLYKNEYAGRQYDFFLGCVMASLEDNGINDSSQQMMIILSSMCINLIRFDEQFGFTHDVKDNNKWLQYFSFIKIKDINKYTSTDFIKNAYKQIKSNKAKYALAKKTFTNKQ